MAPAISPEEVQQLRQENAVLRAQIDWLKKRLFGPGRSETYERAPWLLQLEKLEAAVALAQSQTISCERSNAPRASRPTLAEALADLPVQETVTLVPAEVQAEPAAFEQIGAECSFEVDVVPPKLFKREIVRPKFRRKHDRT